MNKKIVDVATILKNYCFIIMKVTNLNTLGYFVDRTFTNMVKFLNYELSEAGVGLQHPQFTIMMVLGSEDGISQSEITEIVDRDKASVSRNIKYLEGKGYIKKEGRDRKTNLIFLTEKGKEILPLLHKISAKDTERTLKGFSESKKKAVYEILTKMYLNISSAIE